MLGGLPSQGMKYDLPSSQVSIAKYRFSLLALEHTYNDLTTLSQPFIIVITLTAVTNSSSLQKSCKYFEGTSMLATAMIPEVK